MKPSAVDSANGKVRLPPSLPPRLHTADGIIDLDPQPVNVPTTMAEHILGALQVQAGTAASVGELRVTTAAVNDPVYTTDGIWSLTTGATNAITSPSAITLSFTNTQDTPANREALRVVLQAYNTYQSVIAGTEAPENNWIVSSTNPITITSTDANTANMYFPIASAIYGVAGEDLDPGYVQKQLLNHKGAPIRSFHKDKQFENAGPGEILALQLLRKMIAPDDFRRYLRHGFVTTVGRSGLTYQIRRGETIRVLEHGEPVALLCVHLNLDNKSAPPTDHVVGKMLIVECSEEEIWKRSNVTWLDQKTNRRTLESLGVTRQPVPQSIIGAVGLALGA